MYILRIFTKIILLSNYGMKQIIFSFLNQQFLKLFPFVVVVLEVEHRFLLISGAYFTAELQPQAQLFPFK